MRLQEYLEDRGMTITFFAKKAGLTAATIHNVLAGNKDILLSTALKIEEATKQEVTCKELLPLALLPQKDSSSTTGKTKR